MAEGFRMRLTEVSWPGPGGAVVLTGTVEHGRLRGDGELVLLDSEGRMKASVRKAFPAFPGPPSRPGQIRPWPQRSGSFTLYALGIGRKIASPGDALVRIYPAEG
jgi:hypothetical protein